jgi:hypothetical protein
MYEVQAVVDRYSAVAVRPDVSGLFTDHGILVCVGGLPKQFSCLKVSPQNFIRALDTERRVLLYSHCSFVGM